MKGEKSQDTVVGVPASVVWSAYRGLELGKIVSEVLGDVIGKVELVEGDGGVGTIMKLTFPPGTPGKGYLTEKFIIVDDEKRIKVTETIEGGFKDLGFAAIRIRLEIIEKDGESSIVRSTVEYEVDDERAMRVSLISTKHLELMAEGVGKYLSEKKSTA
ncbi:hypothetical protein K2173_004474 [Erythroxylum novogranatense]|uniref:Bet v I/Major latex protein domain-containing protein n=1 Tax=Erythroxylum novogranatense TaxID=1862640 RepID=A0AAV8T574_9ROSI|nr:hypothetical protein K2173_004474 [Erythroxylum novogranatense]